jgi:hypothetical protein
MNDLTMQEMTLPQVKYWNGQRVVTFKDIDEVHNRPKGTARVSFNRNKKHFIENVDYYKITRDNFNVCQTYNENLKGRISSFQETLGKIPPRGLTLITETGYLMIVKSFTDDLSWEVQRRLVNGYFRAREMAETTCQLTDFDLRTSNTLLPKAKSWYDRNGLTLEFLCEAFGVPMKTVYHKILLRLKEEYDLDAAIKQYEVERGYKPKYIMDVVDYFPQLSELATEYINYVANRARNRK